MTSLIQSNREGRALHAWAGDRRVPLQDWQLRPFAGHGPKRRAPERGSNVRLKWPEMRTRRLRVLIALGLDKTEIAERLGLSVNAVVGKCFREGIALCAEERRAAA